MTYNLNFQNASPIDFSIQKNREEFATSVDSFWQSVSKKAESIYPIVAGKEIKQGKQIERISPNDGLTKLANVTLADTELATQSLNKLEAAKASWRRTSLTERAAILDRAADIMTKRRLELCAIIVHEAAKNWHQSDLDVIEAIDFCRYYAELARQSLSSFTVANLPGETNDYHYQPAGLAVIISPWNFPLAIPCGMLVASLVAGNVAVLKPAEQASLIARELVKCLFEAGLPKDVLAFLPGKGEEIGPVLTSAKETQLICFTGSLAVGKEILKNCGQVNEDDRHIKKAILELGGKNALIIDEDADLDEAIKGILYASFAYSGQKCSACSRLIVVGTAYQTLVDRLIPAAAELIIGPSYESASFVGPVIDAEAQTRLLASIEAAQNSTELLFKSEVPDSGTFVPITIFNQPGALQTVWNEELFGPVLAIKKVDNFNAAIELANNSKYALTGGIYSRSPKNIALAKSELEVGNLYINRSCTGAIVGRQPFGGYKLSGIGSKAGGPDYLKQFVVPKVISENTMRRGFAPDIES